MELFTPQFFLGFIVGVICLGIYFIITTPFAGEWARNRIKALKDENSKLIVRLNAVLVGDEQIFQYWIKQGAELEHVKERVRWLEGQNKDLSDVVIVLSNEKSALQDLRNKQYVELDILRTRISKLTAPGYPKSKKVVSKEGKIKDATN